MNMLTCFLFFNNGPDMDNPYPGESLLFEEEIKRILKKEGPLEHKRLFNFLFNHPNANKNCLELDKLIKLLNQSMRWMMRFETIRVLTPYDPRDNNRARIIYYLPGQIDENSDVEDFVEKK